MSIKLLQKNLPPGRFPFTALSRREIYQMYFSNLRIFCPHYLGRGRNINEIWKIFDHNQEICPQLLVGGKIFSRFLRKRGATCPLFISRGVNLTDSPLLESWQLNSSASLTNLLPGAKHGTDLLEGTTAMETAEHMRWGDDRQQRRHCMVMGWALKRWTSIVSRRTPWVYSGDPREVKVLRRPWCRS